MAVSVLVVDDSSFFRRRIKEILDADSHINVIGMASNGREALEKVSQLNPDVITMDIEMPIMDGITAVRRIMATHPRPIMMFSSLTTDGAKATLDALEAGAVDFLPKKFEDISSDRNAAKRQLCARVRIIGARGLPTNKVAKAVSKSHVNPSDAADFHGNDLKQYKMLLIGTSTGGPAALPRILSRLPVDFPLPIVLLQHMPGSFTPPFAQRMNNLCQINIRHAEDRDVLSPGTAILAPGGSQLLIEKKGESYLVRVKEATQEQTYKPSVDITFSSAAQIVVGKVLAIVLTGMGADGREGARQLKQCGSTVWAQDEASCVVAGMPIAVTEAGLADKILSLDDIGTVLSEGI